MTELREEERGMNHHRADRAEDMLAYYVREYDRDGEDFYETAVDGIADILHALRRMGSDAEGAHAMAWRHFIEERTAAGDSL